MATKDRPAAVVVGTRTNAMIGDPNHTMATGKPWRIVTCAHCERCAGMG